MKKLTEKEALQRITHYCSVAEHCLSEANSKLDQWGVTAEAKEQIVKLLIEKRYIDEERYCRAFIRDKLSHNKWGRNKIAQALWEKDICKSISAPLLKEIDTTDYRQMLRKLLYAKRKSYKGTDEQEVNIKLIRFALSRGFDMSDIRLCLAIKDEDTSMVE